MVRPIGLIRAYYNCISSFLPIYTTACKRRLSQKVHTGFLPPKLPQHNGRHLLFWRVHGSRRPATRACKSCRLRSCDWRDTIYHRVSHRCWRRCAHFIHGCRQGGGDKQSSAVGQVREVEGAAHPTGSRRQLHDLSRMHQLCQHYLQYVVRRYLRRRVVLLRKSVCTHNLLPFFFCPPKKKQNCSCKCNIYAIATRSLQGQSNMWLPMNMDTSRNQTYDKVLQGKYSNIRMHSVMHNNQVCVL